MSRPITPEVRRRVWLYRVLVLGALLLVLVGYGIIVNVYFMDDVEDDFASSGNRPCAGLDWPESSECSDALREWEAQLPDLPPPTTGTGQNRSRRQSPSFDYQAESGGEASEYARIAHLTECTALSAIHDSYFALYKCYRLSPPCRDFERIRIEGEIEAAGGAVPYFLLAETTTRGYTGAAYDRMKAIGCLAEGDLLDQLLPDSPPPPPPPPP